MFLRHFETVCLKCLRLSFRLIFFQAATPGIRALNVLDDMGEEMGLAARSEELKEYRLIYLTERAEIWKRVEFSALNVDEAVARAFHDAQGKTVHIWENGKFVQTLNLTNTRASVL